MDKLELEKFLIENDSLTTLIIFIFFSKSLLSKPNKVDYTVLQQQQQQQEIISIDTGFAGCGEI